MKKYLLLMVSMCSVVNAADKGTLYDASGFDVAGVKLGMNRDQAVAAVIEKLGVTEADLRFDKYMREDIVLKTKIPKYFVYEAENVSLQVNMVAAIPVDKAHPLRVNSITYKTTRNNENMLKMRDSAIKKYGTPTNGIREKDHVSMKYSWCTYDEAVKFNSCFNAIGAKLELTAPSLTLHDPSYLKKIQAYMDKQKSADMAF